MFLADKVALFAIYGLLFIVCCSWFIVRCLLSA